MDVFANLSNMLNRYDKSIQTITKSAMTNVNLPVFLLNHPFWKFSLKIYSQPQVENALLILQANHGLNINIILYCCWYAFRGQGRLSKTDLKQLLQVVQYWHDKVTVPLRRLRTSLKKSQHQQLFSAIYQDTLKYELFAEQVEQLLIADVFVYEVKPIRTSLQKIIDGCKNIVTYCQTIKISLAEEDQAEITELLAAIFNKVDRNDIVKYCKNVIINGENSSTTITSQLPLDL